MTNVEDLKNREQVSDLMDGRLRGSAFAEAVELASQDDQARAAWHANHVIGDVLRFGDVTNTVGAARSVGAEVDVQFVERFRARMAQMPESGLSASLPLEMAGESESRLNHQRSDSANDSIFRWKMLAGVASLTAVAAIGWSVLGNGASPASGGAAGGQVAQKAIPTEGVVAGETAQPQVMIRDPHLDALLAAHKQFGGTSALQMPAGFLRNATFEGPSR